MAHLRTRQKIANKAEEPFKHATRPLKNAALAPLIPPQQGVEMIQLASRLNRKAGNAGKVASGKENVVEVLGKQKERSGPNARAAYQGRQTQYGAKRTKRKLCVAPSMEVDKVCDDVTEEGLPEGVIDIDIKETDPNATCGMYGRVNHSYLKLREMAHSVNKKYLEDSGWGITEKMRKLLVDWMVDNHQLMDLVQETLFLSVRLLDRYLQEEVTRTSTQELQLVGTTALFLACKVEETYLPSVEDFVYITDDAITGDEIRDMEVRMMETLHFELHSPTSLTFLRRYSRAGDVDETEHCLAKYILELGLTDLGLSALPPSLAAAGALLLSLKLLEPELGSPWSLSLEHHSGYRGEVLAPVTRRMAEMLRDSPGHTLQAVRNKYSSRKYKQIAISSSLAPELLSKHVGYSSQVL